MAYKIKYQKQAVLDAAKLQKTEPSAFKKLLKLEAELREHLRHRGRRPCPYRLRTLRRQITLERTIMTSRIINPPQRGFQQRHR